MNDTKVKTIQEIMAEKEAFDATTILDRFWAEMGTLRGKLLDAVELHPHEQWQDLRDGFVSIDGTARGELLAYRGPKVDYFVNSYLGNPALGFTNVHFNVWTSENYLTPHLGLVLGTIPDLFFYADFTSRVDMVEDGAYLDRYHGSINDQWLKDQENDSLTPFTSVDPYIRLSASPVAQGYSAALTEENLQTVFALAHSYLDTWLGWIADPEPTPADQVAAVRRRDVAIRKQQGFRDPANPIGIKFFGAERGRYLLSGLWGMDVHE
jgi:hypothetical protein